MNRTRFQLVPESLRTTRQGVRDLNFVVDRLGRKGVKPINGHPRTICRHPPGCGVAMDMVFVADENGGERLVDLLECCDCGTILGPETKFDRFPDWKQTRQVKSTEEPCLLMETWLREGLEAKLTLPDQPIAA